MKLINFFEKILSYFEISITYEIEFPYHKWERIKKFQ